jgi:hypothetical protein
VTFQALKTLCDLINQTINNSLTQYYSNQYISASVIPLKLFEPETKLLVDGFRLAMTNNLLLSLSMIRNTTQANALISLRGTNYKLKIAADNVHVLAQDITYDCACAFSSTCTQACTLYHHADNTLSFKMPGIYSGCYVIELVFQSTLECFYDQDCIDKIQIYSAGMQSINITALDASLSNYSIKSTIGELVENLMIEQWYAPTIFENYYNECQPIQCTFTFETNNDLIYIFTTLFGVAGGLVTVLNLVIPRLVNPIMYCIRKQRSRVSPEIIVLET